MRTRLITDESHNLVMVTNEKSIQRRWEDYFEDPFLSNDNTMPLVIAINVYFDESIQNTYNNEKGMYEIVKATK